jgi:hypothetical protein
MVLLASSYDESRFFKAGDLENEIRLKIKNVTEEKMADGEMKLTVWFTTSKRGLVLNRTNNRTIRGAFGDDVAAWSGKVIVLYPTTAEFRGKIGPALRVRIPTPKDSYRAPAPQSPPHRGNGASAPQQMAPQQKTPQQPNDSPLEEDDDFDRDLDDSIDHVGR